MTARLILLTGSQAGLEAPLLIGYYMIGRHADCQIRPKSRSVSRRHCLVHHHDDGVRILDLGSASGTRLNDRKLPVKNWFPVKEGDTVRLGKVQFQVSLASDCVVLSDPPLDSIPETGSTAAEAPVAELRVNESAANNSPVPNSPVINSPVMGARPSAAKVPATRGSMVTGAAWETFDVAGFLANEDDLDRADRYDQIRAKNVFDDDQGAEFDDDSVVDPFDDESVTVVDELTAARGPKTTPKSIPKSLPSAKRDWNHLGRFRSIAETDSLKLTAAFVMVVLVIGFLGWKTYQFVSGPEVRVIKQID